MKTDAEQIAQWVIDNRYSKGEYQTMPDHELYHTLVDKINATQRTAEVGGLIKYIDSEILYFEDLAAKNGINQDGRVRLETFRHIKELLNRTTALPEPPKNSEDGK